MIELRMRLPGNWSRTRTQATIVPMTDPITATIADITSVVSSALRATLLVNEVQNACHPEPNATSTTAATGIRTKMLRYSVDRPSPSAPPAPRVRGGERVWLGVPGDGAPRGAANVSAGGGG